MARKRYWEEDVLQLLRGLDHAREKISEWVQDYNHHRPHSSLGYDTPANFADELRKTGRKQIDHPTPEGVQTAEALMSAG